MAKTRQEWAKPEVDWLPLGKATFKFGMSHESGPSHVQQKHADTVEVTKGIRSEHQLMELLKKESGAQSAEINQETATFTFHFVRVGGGASVTRGAPWAISRKQQGTAVHVDPQIEAEALFSTHGLMRIGDEEAKTNREEFDTIRKATGLVWRQFMLHAFDRAVSAETAILYARPRNLLAKFERLPADAWPLLKVMDWQNGVAFAPDGTAYWSIHAQLAEVERSCRPDPPPRLASRQPRGPKTGKRKAIEEKLKADILAKRLTVETLQKMPEKALAGTYDVSRDTVRKARDQVIFELSPGSKADK